MDFELLFARSDFEIIRLRRGWPDGQNLGLKTSEGVRFETLSGAINSYGANPALIRPPAGQRWDWVPGINRVARKLAWTS